MDKHPIEGMDHHGGGEPRKPGGWQASPFWAAATVGGPLVLLSILGLQVPADLQGIFALGALAVLLIATWLARGIWWIHASNEDYKDDPWEESDFDRLKFWLQMGLRRNIHCRLDRHLYVEEIQRCMCCGRPVPMGEDGVPLHWATYRVVLKDGTSEDVRAIDREHAFALVVYGQDALDRMNQEDEEGGEEAFAVGGEQPPLGQLRVHPSHIVSVTQLQGARA